MLRINALGRLVVLGAGGPVLGSAAQPRRLALLAVIARAGSRGITRTKVVEVLWPESDEEHGRGVLSKALSALRRDLGAEDFFLGTNHDLRLNPALVSTDLDEFDAAVASGQLEKAAALYVGPFLDGFRVAGADDFEQWAATERALLQRAYVSALGELASAATTRGNHVEAARWWGRLSAYEPLDTRHAIALMRALVAAGEPRTALQHARMYELLVAQSLDVPADREVIALAEEIRASVSSVSGDTLPRALGATPSPATAAAREPVDPPRERRASRHAWRVAAAIVLASALLAAGVWRTTRGSPASEVVIALGRIVDQRVAPTDDLAGPLAVTLTNHLTRNGAVRVASVDRAREVLAILSHGADLDGAMLAAARRAGATELVDGAVYSVADGRLRLDLRRTDLTSGTLRAVRSVSAADPLALADSAATHLIAVLGAAGRATTGADRSPWSFAVHRRYEEGLRAYYRGDRRLSVNSFDAALASDSTFAMAAYYGALATDDGQPAHREARFRRALALARQATDRDRLTILAGWAHETSSPSLFAFADTLVARYPHEPDGHLFAGIALIASGRVLAARVPLERAIALDATALDRTEARCIACDGLSALVAAYVRADSLAAAERAARTWARVSPGSVVANARLEEILARRSTPRARSGTGTRSTAPSTPEKR